MDSQSKDQHNMQDADADYNSSEYTHSNLDPTIESNDQPSTSSTAQQQQQSGQDAAQSEPSAVDHSHAMEAVMQLAQAASQQQYDSEQHSRHGHLENPEVHHESLPVNNADGSTGGAKRGEKRRSSQSGSTSGAAAGGRRASKAARQQDEEQDLSSAAAAVAAATEGASLPFPDSWSEGNIPAEIQKAYQQHLAQAQANLAQQQQQTQSSSSASLSHDDASQAQGSGGAFKPTRQLSTSKRAAQNRAAQRAFRERRDRYVKVLESKATRLEAAIRIATECKRRYVEALQTIDGLRQDNHTLRVALAALSGSGDNAGPGPVMKADDLAKELSEIPLLTTQEEEEVLGSVGGQTGMSGGSAGGSGSGSVSASGGGQSLDSLSAVAAAAAAAAAQGDGTGAGTDGDKVTQQQQQQQQGAGEGDESVSTPPTPTSAGEGKGVSAAAVTENTNASGVLLPPVPSATTSSTTGGASAQ
ncbi:hypothetical protein NDA13_006160 [Ustilago tritici]|nr:hypothetical protein NDA13_006160 [Ustilago tritici]